MLTLALVLIVACWFIFGFAEMVRVRNGGKPKQADEFPWSAFWLFFAGWVYSITAADIANIGTKPERVAADIVRAVANVPIGFLIAILVGETIRCAQNAFDQYLQKTGTKQTTQPPAEKEKNASSTALAIVRGTAA